MTSACRRIPKAAIPALLLLALTLEVQAQYVEDSIESGRFVYDLAYNYRSGYVLGVSWEATRLFSIECNRNMITHALHVSSPLRIAYNAVNNTVYCTYGAGADDTVLVAHGWALNPLKRIPLLGAERPLWDSVSNRVYVACGLENDVAVIDCETDSVICRIPVGETPSNLELNTLRRKLYVRNWDGESVSIIDLETNQVIRTIRLGGVSGTAGYCRGVDKYYVGVSGGVVVAIDGAGDSIVSRYETPPGVAVEALAVVEAHALVMIGADAVTTDSVYVLDALSDTVIAAHHLGRAMPETMLWSSVSDLVYCACWQDVVFVLRGDGSGIVSQLRVGYAPCVLAAAPEYRRVYVGHSGSHHVFVIRDTVSGIAEHATEPDRKPLLEAHPNPFRWALRIETANHSGPARLAVYSRDGRLVRTLVPGQDPRSRDVVWDGRDDSGKEVPAGVYTIRTAGDIPNTVLVVKTE